MNNALKLHSLLATMILACAACPASGGAEVTDSGIEDNGGPDASARDSGAVVSRSPDAARPDAGTIAPPHLDAGSFVRIDASTAPPDSGAAAPPDAAAVAVDSGSCAPSCGSAQCGDDGCGGSCGSCLAGQWCGGAGVQGQCGTSTTIDAYPGITPTQVDFGTISGLLVASDEQHVLIQRAEDSSYSSAPLAVVTVGPGGAGATCELTTKTWLDNGMARAGFTDDAAALFFVDDSVSPPALIVANADGSQQRTLATGMIQNAIARGSTLVYDFDPTSGGYAYQHWAVQLPSGTPVQLNSHLSAVEVPEQYVNSTGTATIISNGGATYSQDLVQTATGTDLQFTASSTIWSPDGTHLAYWQQPIYDLHVIDSDGTNDVVVLQAMASYPLWSPDGSAIAAKISDATGYAAHDVKVHYFDGRSQIALTSTDDISAGVLHFSGDGSVLFIEGVNSKALYFAPVKQGAAFTSLIADLQFSDPYDLEIPSFESTYSGDHVAAFVAGARSVVVAPVGAGTQITLPPQMGATPYYEPVNASPDLLTWVYTGYEMPGDLAVFPTDGSGTGVVLPGTVDFAVTMAQEEHPPPFGWEVQDLSGSPFTWGWLGSAVVYQLSGSAMGSDVVAATGRGSVAGVIAPGTKVWSASNMVNPTRIFFAQYGANGGLWWSPIPK